MNSNVTIERKRVDCNYLPKGWQREEVIRKPGLSTCKVDVYYYSPAGKKIESKPQLARQLGDGFDLSSFDFQTGKIIQHLPPLSISLHLHGTSSSGTNAFKRKCKSQGHSSSSCNTITTTNMNTNSSSNANSTNLRQLHDFR